MIKRCVILLDATKLPQLNVPGKWVAVIIGNHVDKIYARSTGLWIDAALNNKHSVRLITRKNTNNK